MAGDEGPAGAANGAARASPVDEPAARGALPASVACPFCASRDTEPFAAFGSQASTAQYYCSACRTVFELLRWR